MGKTRTRQAVKFTVNQLAPIDAGADGRQRAQTGAGGRYRAQGAASYARSTMPASSSSFSAWSMARWAMGFIQRLVWSCHRRTVCR